nr:uncharacterized protein LOC112038818 [Quercus suber]
MVSSLIDPMTRWWKLEIVRALFLPFKADIILKIPLSFNLPNNKLILIGNKKGEFTVKSAYFVASKLLDSRDDGECSFGDSNGRTWRKIWSLKLSEKVKIFSWRACVNGLPVLTKMAAKGIQTCCVCPICDEEPESLLHALISCDFALSVWSLWHDYPIDLLLKASDFNDLVLHLCSSPSALCLEFFFAIAWSIWCNRYKHIHDENSMQPLQVLEIAKSLVEDFREASSWDFPSPLPPQCGWVAPPPGYFKVNVDGASSIDGSGVFGVGAVIRDELGLIVAALCKALPMHYPAEWTELLALEHGVLLAQALNLRKVIFESNVFSVIAVVSQVNGGGIMGHLVQSFQFVASVFNCWYKKNNMNFQD